MEIPEIDESIEAAAPAAPVSTTTTAEVAPATEEVEEPMNRQWTLSTPAGPTAFVLDARQFETSMALDRLNQRVWLSDSPVLWLGVNYGLTDALTAFAAVGLNKTALGVRWNFYNSETWSFGGGPWIGYQFRRPSSYWGLSSQMPLGGYLSASRVIDHRHKFHAGLEIARNKGQRTSDQYYYAGDGEESLRFARLAGTYEIRLNRRHAMMMWAAFELTRSQSATSGGGDYPWTDSYSNSATAIMYGMGYQYLRESLALEVGLELGPKWTTTDSTNSYRDYPSYSYQWDGLGVGGSLTASLSYRL